MKVLFAVLNWGIGHATRSTVIIEALLKENHQVFIFSNGKALRFLQERYGDNCVYINGASTLNYNYTNSNTITYASIAYNLYKAAKHDTKLLKKHIKTDAYQLLINDCRPLYINKLGIKSYLINHQLKPNWPFLKNIVQKRFIKWQNKFTAVWIPDFDNSLFSNELSKEPAIKNKKWLGPLSRFNFFYGNENLNHTKQKHLLFYGYKRSEIDDSTYKKLNEVFNKISFLDTEKASARPDETIIKNVQQANCIISKPGYSSIMELYNCPATVVLIDKAWHAEQHYLYEHHRKNLFFTCLPSVSFQEIASLSDDNYRKKPRITNKKLLTLAIDSILK